MCLHFLPFLQFLWSSISKRCIYNFLLCWIHVIIGWKMFTCFKNCVERIESLQINWSIIKLAICISWFWIWNNVVSCTPPTSTPKLVIQVIRKRVYNIPRIYLRPSTKYIFLWKRMNKMRKSNIRNSSAQSTGAY